MAKLIWTEKAVKSLEDIAGFIELDSPHYARKTVRDIFELTETLKTFPYIGKFVSEFEDDRSLRQLFYKTYRVIYRVSDESVYILTVFSGFRDLSKAIL